MSKAGHTIAALAVGAYIALAIPHGTLLGVTTVLGGGLPDSLEGVVGFGPGGERRSLIPHRTLTHSPWGWLALLAAGLLLPAAHTPWGPLAIGKAAAGLALGAVVHLALDLCSPMGIPIGNPFGRRVSLGPYRTALGRRFLYRTSTVSESPLLAPFVAMLVAEVAMSVTHGVAGGTPNLVHFVGSVLAGV